MKILLIEDDLTLNQNIAEALKAESFNVVALYDGALAARVMKKESFDCIVMDVNLPGTNGFDLCKDFRTYNTHTPVIFLTAFSELDDKVLGYNNGADDYLTKPFFMRELVLRIHSLVKRSQTTTIQSKVIVADDLIIDTRTKKVTRQGEEVLLTPREYQILIKICENKGEVVSKTELIEEIWGKSFDANTNTIEVYINFLRNKIDKPFNKNNIKTKVGYGYYFE